MNFLDDYKDLNWEEIKDDTIIVVPILSDPNLHRQENRISFIYIQNLNKEEEYIISCNHYDLNKNGEDWIKEVQWPKRIFSYNGNVLRDYGIENYDIELIYWLETNERLELSFSQDILIYYNWYKSSKYTHDFIPLISFIPFCKIVCTNLKKHINLKNSKYTLDFYSRLTNNFRILENNGLPINYKEVDKHFNFNYKHIYSNYNVFSLTGRPSNTYNGINLAALNKDDGSRKVIEVDEKDWILMELDYESYHLRLAANLIKYDLPETSLHDYFGKLYFGKDELTKEEYEESKGISFRGLYGRQEKVYENFEFFKRIYILRNKLIEKYKKDGFIRMPLSKRKLQKNNLENISSSKLFNYILQGYETEMNSLILADILDYLKDKKSKCILYTYDALLFKISKDEFKEIPKNIKQIMEQNKMRTRISLGYNYDNLKKIN